MSTRRKHQPKPWNPFPTDSEWGRQIDAGTKAPDPLRRDSAQALAGDEAADRFPGSGD